MFMLRYFMFGPGTHCRCATCHRLPDDCQWAGGPYAGTLLLYAQVYSYVVARWLPVSRTSLCWYLAVVCSGILLCYCQMIASRLEVPMLCWYLAVICSGIIICCQMIAIGPEVHMLVPCCYMLIYNYMLPDDYQSAGGPYASTLLLYGQV